MGAHVWGPAFLRDHLLPEGRLSGLDARLVRRVPRLPVLHGGPVAADRRARRRALRRLDDDHPAGRGGLRGGRERPGIRAGGAGRSSRLAVVVVVGGVELPYGTAFKLVTVLGVVSLPLCAYAFGRLADLPFPGPALLAVASVLFLFDRNFTIYGGNVASTLAGEFAFSISLSLSLLYLGVVIRGLRTGKHRALAAVLLALTGLCHLIPAFFALAGTVVIALLRRPARRTLVWLVVRRSPSAGLISAFWVLPFAWQRAYVNDMGWEKLPYATAENGFRSWSGTLFTFNGETYWKYLIPRPTSTRPTTCAGCSRWPCMGLVLSIAFRVRAGLVLAGCALVMAVAFVLAARGPALERAAAALLLPVPLPPGGHRRRRGRAHARRARRPRPRPSRASSGPSSRVVTAMLLDVRRRRAARCAPCPSGSCRPTAATRGWASPTASNQDSFVRSWARWNYTGYEGKDAYAEYRDLILTMEEVGEEHGCGRSFWEYEKEINRYGTPMALMLLPHWTDGCIGSMEGLFFEASATTPFHFLTQVELQRVAERGPARPALRRLRHRQGREPPPADGRALLPGHLGPGDHAARAPPRPHRAGHLGSVGDLRGGRLRPGGAARERAGRARRRRATPSTTGSAAPRTTTASAPARPSPGTWTWPTRTSCSASSGPDEWQRVDADDPQPEVRPVAPVGGQRASRPAPTASPSTSTTPGSPVLVKASYFPNWRVSGADGPYRVAPNLMVVVPTDEHVELTYGREPVEWVALRPHRWSASGWRSSSPCWPARAARPTSRRRRERQRARRGDPAAPRAA